MENWPILGATIRRASVSYRTFAARAAGVSAVAVDYKADDGEESQ